MILDWYSKESIAFDKLISSWFAFLSTYLGSNHLLNIVVDKKNEIENIDKRDKVNHLIALLSIAPKPGNNIEIEISNRNDFSIEKDYSEFYKNITYLGHLNSILQNLSVIDNINFLSYLQNFLSRLVHQLYKN